MSRADRVGIVGAGPFGTVLANLVARAGRPALIWSRDASVVRSMRDAHANPRVPGVALAPAVDATDDPAHLAEEARFIVLAVSSADAHDRLVDLGAHLGGQHILVHAIGALAGPDDVPVSRLIERETPVLRLGALAGPALWRDLAAGTFSSMVVASRYDEVTREARRLLAVPPVLRLYQSRDLIGVELAAALSGAYTLAIGVADGLSMGPGPRAVLITRAVAEAGRLGRAIGAEEKTVTGLAGLGNLLVRTQSEHATDYLAGRALALGQRLAAETEGSRAAMAGVRLARRTGVMAPVLSAVAAVLAGELSPRDAAIAAAGTVADEE